MTFQTGSKTWLRHLLRHTLRSSPIKSPINRPYRDQGDRSRFIGIPVKRNGIQNNWSEKRVCRSRFISRHKNVDFGKSTYNWGFKTWMGQPLRHTLRSSGARGLDYRPSIDISLLRSEVQSSRRARGPRPYGNINDFSIAGTSGYGKF